MKKIFLTIFLTPLLACSPEVGSEKWCEQLKEKPKGEWTANDTSNFTKHCIFRKSNQ